MTSIVIQMMLMSSNAHQLGSCSVVPCSTLALVLFISASMQGYSAKALQQLPLLEDAKQDDEKAPKPLRTLKKSTKSTKSDKNDDTIDVVDPAPEEEEDMDFKQVGEDIPRVGTLDEPNLITMYGDIRNTIHLVGMSDDGQRFADTNNIYEYDETSRSWNSLSPESFVGYSIFGMSGDGETVICAKYNENSGNLLLETRRYDNDTGTWPTKDSRWIPYVPSKRTQSRHFFSTGVSALSRDGKRFVLTDDERHRIFQYNSENGWVRIGKKIRGDESRVLGINDDGSRIAIQGQGDAVNVYELVQDENSKATWKQLGGDVGIASWPPGNIGTTNEFSMSSSGNRIIIGVKRGYYDKYYYVGVAIKEYNSETQEWEQIGNEIPAGGKHVKISADGNTVAVGRSTDLNRYYYGDTSCCNNYVKFYKLWQGDDGEAEWDEVARITSGPRRFFSYYMAATDSLNRMVIAASDTYSVFDVTFSDVIGPCLDQEGTSFPLTDIDKEVRCGWLNRGNILKRRRMYCVESYDGGSVMKACRKSCGLCTPSDYYENHNFGFP